MPLTTGLMMANKPVMLNAPAIMSPSATPLLQMPKLPPYLWYEAGVLWAGQGPAAKLLPIGFDRQTAFKNCMLANVNNPSFPTMHGAYAASFQVASFTFNGQSCLVAVALNMTSLIWAFCNQNGIKQTSNGGGCTTAMTNGGATPYSPVYPASLLTSVSAQSPGGQATVNPQFILCTGTQASQPPDSLGGCLFVYSGTSSGTV